MIDKETQKKIVDLISALVPNAQIILFGSRSRGTASTVSDIDIALKTSAKLPSRTVAEVKNILEASNIIFKIDVVDFNNVSQDMKDSILDEGIIWKN